MSMSKEMREEIRKEFGDEFCEWRKGDIWAWADTAQMPEPLLKFWLDILDRELKAHKLKSNRDMYKQGRYDATFGICNAIWDYHETVSSEEVMKAIKEILQKIESLEESRLKYELSVSSLSRDGGEDEGDSGKDNG